MNFSYLILIAYFFLSSTLMAFAATVDVKPGKVIAVKHFVFDTVPMNLEELSLNAKTIFSGTCLKVSKIKKDPLSKLSVVEITFLVKDGIKGVKPGEKFQFKQWDALSRQNSYVIGEDYVLFLHGESKAGLTSPVGILQGQFKIFKENGINVVKNKANNFGLVENPKTKARVSLGNKKLEEHLLEQTKLGNSINHKDFLNVVKQIAEKENE